MKHISSYVNFLNEEIIDSSPEIIKGKKNQSAEMKQDMDKYKQQKMTIQKIYDDNTLDDKTRQLRLQGIIGTEKTRINPYLQLWSQICSLKSKVQKIMTDTQNKETEIKKEETNQKSTDPEQKEM
jgi:hypothetical protein